MKFCVAEGDVLPSDVLAAESANAVGEVLVVEFQILQTWLPAESTIKLYALYCVGTELTLYSVVESLDKDRAAVLEMVDSQSDFRNVLSDWQVPVFSSTSMVLLQTVDIPKPWGKEIWYTGIEKRGVCRVGSDSCSLALPQLLPCIPSIGRRAELVLLKILAPLPDAVYGDLYFELHEEKQEVYVVTDVDSRAWPGGTGGIRFGFDPQRIESYESLQAFHDEYLNAVKRYQEVRRRIDELFDGRRREQGIGENDLLSAEMLQEWTSQLDTELQAEEEARRIEMDGFTQVLPLQVGDVVKVPRHVPHSLQHGVTTIEFQTPVYERKIVSFAQKVLTQSHWDTDAALETALPVYDFPRDFPAVNSPCGLIGERIVDFDEFLVDRFSLAASNSMELEVTGGSYALVIVISGVASLAGEPLAAKQACLLPGNTCTLVSAPADEELLLLVARPK